MLYHLLHIPFSPSLRPHALSFTPQALSLKPYPLNKIKHALLLLAFLLVGVTSAMAQLHPIQLNLICPPTLPGSVNGLYQANGLKATLTLLDKYQPSLEVGVGFTMRGNGVTIEKRPDYLGETPTLLFAMPKVLGEDFFSSLLQEGVSYNGPNRDAFESKGTLTSGRYELTLWAYDLNRPAVRISNLARVYLWIQKSNPPTLTFPLDKAIVYAIPQQFSWTVAPSSNGLTTPRYKFLLYELNDPNRDPADEVMCSEPFFEEEVAAPTFSYLTYHPQLIRGKGYAWRIQAVAYDQNQQEIPLFNNNGFSAIRSFSYGQDATSTLKQLLAIEAKSKNPYSMDVKVVADPSGKMDTPDGFKLEYRKAGAEEWSQVEVDDDYTTLAKLTPNTEYELRGYPRMGALYGDAGPMVKARTQSPPEVKCGTKSSYKPDASTKLASLATGDIVTANQIPFTITAVKNSDGSFTGMAFAGVPFFGGKKLAYKLNNATFNSKYELTGGSIVADTIGIERYINKKVAEQAAKQATANEKKGDILADEKTVKVGGDIKDVTSIKVDTSDKEHPKAIVTTVDGKEQVVDIPKNGTITLADSTGEVYTASSDGTVNNIGMYAGAASGTGTMAGSVQQKPKKLYGADLLVEFQPDPQQLYGFDNPFSLGENFWKEKYDTTQVAGRTFFVPAKMVAAGATDKVVATLKGEAADHPENLSFTTTTGMRYMASPGLAKGTLQLTLAGGAPDSRQELTAWMKQGDSTVAVGRLSIDAFQSISRRVVVVPVGDATYDQAAALAEGLNGIYKQAGVRWDATVADQVLPMPEGVGESIKVDKSLFSAYSAGMRRIRSAFCSTSTYQRLGDQDIYYIFLTTLPMNGEDENAPFDGYMPYGKPFGFVRSAGMGATELAWTIAHELGHGAFQLQHVWKEQGYTTDTRNLMGYSKTGELFRWQWQDIHHPVSHSNLLADEEDLGSMFQKLNYYYGYDPSTYKNAKGYNFNKDEKHTFIAPSGLPFTLSGKIGNCLFRGSLINKMHQSINKPTTLDVIDNSLTSFEFNGYVYAAVATNDNFEGYRIVGASSTNKTPIKEKLFSEESFKDDLTLPLISNISVIEFVNRDKGLEKLVVTPELKKKKAPYFASGKLASTASNLKCFKCGQSIENCYCGKACLCFADDDCIIRRNFIPHLVGIPLLYNDGKIFNVVKRTQVNTSRWMVYELIAYRIYMSKVGVISDNDNLVYKMLDGLEQSTDYLLDNAKSMSDKPSFVKAVKELKLLSSVKGKVGLLGDINTINNAITSGNFDSVVEMVVGKIPYANGFISFVEWAMNKKNQELWAKYNYAIVVENQKQRNSTEKMNYERALQCYNDAVNRINTLNQIEATSKHLKICTCFKK